MVSNVNAAVSCAACVTDFLGAPGETPTLWVHVHGSRSSVMQSHFLIRAIAAESCSTRRPLDGVDRISHRTKSGGLADSTGFLDTGGLDTSDSQSRCTAPGINYTAATPPADPKSPIGFERCFTGAVSLVFCSLPPKQIRLSHFERHPHQTLKFEQLSPQHLSQVSTDLAERPIEKRRRCEIELLDQ